MKRVEKRFRKYYLYKVEAKKKTFSFYIGEPALLGDGFDPQTIPDPRTPDNLHHVSGRGLFLIRNFMHQVAHNAVGNQITMTKLRKDDKA